MADGAALRASGAADHPEPDGEPRRDRRDRSRSPRVQSLRSQAARLSVRNVGIFRGGTAALRATLNVVQARADNLDRNVRALCNDAGKESLPSDYYQNVDKTITQATECSKLLEAMRVSFAMVTEGIL
jgi:hypothetical protein